MDCLFAIHLRRFAVEKVQLVKTTEILERKIIRVAQKRAINRQEGKLIE